MKKLFVFVMALFISAALFAEVAVTSTTDYDADAVNLTEKVEAIVGAGPVTVGNTLIFSGLTAPEGTEAEPDIDWALAVDYALNEAITLGAKTGYTVEDAVPLTVTGSWKINFLTFSAKYVNDNLNPAEGEEAEKGAFQLVVKAVF